ncbi:MAG: hypothetical protein KGI24_02565 [Candidatus Omnitrophica bacterium]|nr:hypothetical protein [Candidatus Omnitrophota bacterium]MDE2214288.1 hypothetical protein [Candidatus Omnitrophota bacterium]MDE2231325.1 hypothetical protein [Candidatus Omnitrophota bacterium]
MEDSFILKKKDSRPAKGIKASLKKNILIGVVGMAGAVLLAALGWYLYFESQFTVYRDSQYQFSIKYPKTWKVVTAPKPNVAVAFLRPKDTVLDTVTENFTVVVQPLSVQDHVLAVFNANVKNQMLAVFGKHIIIARDQPMHWGWRQGHEMVFKAPVPDHLVMVNAWTLRIDHAYIMTYFGDLNKFSKDSLIVDEMIRSFRLQ